MITKRIYLVFPPGCSGNHLANMIALDDGVEDRFVNVDEMEKHYLADTISKHPINSPTTFKGFQNLNNVDVDIVTNATKTQILCCHARELGHAVSFGDLPEELLDDSVFILFSYPTEGSFVHHRHRSGPWINGEHPDSTVNGTFIIDDNSELEIKDAYQKDNFIKEWLNPRKKAIDPDVVFEFDTLPVVVCVQSTPSSDG